MTRPLKERLSGLSFAKVFTSPLQRVTRTCELAGFGDRAEIDRDLVEWDYGDYEGRRTPDIHKERPDWQLFYDGCPEGESPADVGVRTDRIIQRVRAVDGPCHIPAAKIDRGNPTASAFGHHDGHDPASLLSGYASPIENMPD